MPMDLSELALSTTMISCGATVCAISADRQRSRKASPLRLTTTTVTLDDTLISRPVFRYAATQAGAHYNPRLKAYGWQDAPRRHTLRLPLGGMIRGNLTETSRTGQSDKQRGDPMHMHLHNGQR